MLSRVCSTFFFESCYLTSWTFLTIIHRDMLLLPLLLPLLLFYLEIFNIFIAHSDFLPLFFGVSNSDLQRGLWHNTRNCFSPRWPIACTRYSDLVFWCMVFFVPCVWMLNTFLKVTPTQNRLAYPFCGDLAALQLQALMSGLVCEIHFLLLLKYLLFSSRSYLLEAG